jgi:hypothetical protein
MGYANINNPANYQLAAFGQFGFRKITTGQTGQSGEQYRVVFALENSTISVTAENGDDLSAQAVLAGTAIYGLFDSVEVVSGTVLAYIA